MQKTQLKPKSSILESGKNRLYQLWLIQNQLQEKFQNHTLNQKCIFLVGDVNVGKTTLLYYLSGLKLNLVQDQIKKTKEMKPQEVYQNAIVRNMLSTTQIPNLFSGIQTLPEVSLIDMPGMNDIRFLSVISNLFTFEFMFEKMQRIKKIHILYVISEEIFDYQEIKDNLQQFAKIFNVNTFQQEKNLSLIFTKTEDDEDDVKQKFFEFIEELKEEIQDEEDPQMKALVNNILQLKQNQDAIYFFPKSDPIQQEGERITQSISERNKFVQNDLSSTLSKDFIDHALYSSKLKLSNFQNNLIELVQQAHFSLETGTEFAIELVKLMHKKYFPQLFKTDEEFKEQVETFSQKFLQLLIQFGGNNGSDNEITVNEIAEFVTFVCQNLSEEQSLWAIDQQTKNIFILQNPSLSSTTVEQETSNIKFTQFFASSLSKIFDKVVQALAESMKTSIIMSSIKNIEKFIKWLSETWYPSLVRVKSLSRVSQSLQDNDKKFIELRDTKWGQICENKVFFEAIVELSSKAGIQSEQESQQQQKSQKQIQPTSNYGYAGKSMRQLKQTYFQTKDKHLIDQLRNKVEDSRSQDERVEQQAREKKIGEMVKQLQKQVLEQVSSQQHPQKINAQLDPEKIALILFLMKNLRHKIFLQSAFKNFIPYLKFMIYLMKKPDQRQKLSEVVNGFIDNLCRVLDQYSLFEEEVLMYLFVNDLQQVKRVINKGFCRFRIGKDFLMNSLFPNLYKIAEKATYSSVIQDIADILTKSYSYLISEYSSSRQQKSDYQTKLQKTLKELYQNNQIKEPQTQNKSNPTFTHISLNYFILEPSLLSIKNIVEKIKAIDARNSTFKAYEVYKKFNSNFGQQVSNLSNKQTKASSQAQKQQTSTNETH